MSSSNEISLNSRRAGLTVHACATQRNLLPFGHAALLGTVMTPKGARAYVHLGRGRIQRVKTGDIVQGAKISAIESGALILTRASDTRRLTLPQH